MDVTVAVIAKAPEPGRVKTRLCPPCTPGDAARIAAAALADTIDVVRATRCTRRVVAVDGAMPPAIVGDLDVVPQRRGELDERLAGLFDDLAGPAIVIAMDTPQLTPPLLESAIDRLRAGYDAVLGPALDGGYWAIGLRHPDPACFLGVRMHGAHTGAEQLTRLHERQLSVALLPTLRDVDTFGDAMAVAAEIPDSRFAGAVDAVRSERCVSSEVI